MSPISIETYYDNIPSIKPIESIDMSLHKEETSQQEDDHFNEQLQQELLAYRQMKAAQKYQKIQSLRSFL